MERLRVGVIGLRFGEHHVRTLLDMEEVELVAVADRNRHAKPGERGIEEFVQSRGVKVYRDGALMMEKEKLDAVTIAVSPRAREPLLAHALDKRLPMFIEKPWATNMEHARKLAEMCRQSDTLVMVGFSFRYHPAIVRLRRLMDDVLGPAWLLNGEYVFNFTPPADFWMWDPQNGNGIFNENSCHLLDAVCYLLGRPVSVTAEGGIFAGSPSEDAAAVVLRFESGAVAALTIGGVGAKAFRDSFPRIHVFTQNGQAELSGSVHIWNRLTWSVRSDLETTSVFEPPELLGRTRYTDAMRHFVDCVKNGRQPTATVEDGVRAVALAEAIYASIRSGNKVRIGE